jgi:hypothetical protein
MKLIVPHRGEANRADWWGQPTVVTVFGIGGEDGQVACLAVAPESAKGWSVHLDRAEATAIAGALEAICKGAIVKE